MILFCRHHDYTYTYFSMCITFLFSFSLWIRTVVYFNKLQNFFLHYWNVWTDFVSLDILTTELECEMIFLPDKLFTYTNLNNAPSFSVFALHWLLWWYSFKDSHTGQLWLSNGCDYITFHSSLCILAGSQGWRILAYRLLRTLIPHVTGSPWHVTNLCCDITYVCHRSFCFGTWQKCLPSTHK